MTRGELIDYITRHYHVDIDAGELRHRGGRRGSRGEGALAGYINVDGYRVIQCAGKNYYVHRIIWLMANGRWPRAMIDHINRTKDDNRVANLREADNSLNKRNREPSADRVPGVSVDRRRRRFIAYIQPEGQKRIYLGYFESYGAACRERVRAEVEHKNGVTLGAQSPSDDAHNLKLETS